MTRPILNDWNAFSWAVRRRPPPKPVRQPLLEREPCEECNGAGCEVCFGTGYIDNPMEVPR